LLEKLAALTPRPEAHLLLYGAGAREQADAEEREGPASAQ
jgi:hypothetical protein